MSDPYAGLGTPLDAGDPYAGLGTPVTPQSMASKAGDAGKLAVRGATSEGFYFGMEGLSRMASLSAPKVAAGIPGTDAAGIDVNLDRLRARRRELLGEPSAYSTSANEEAPPWSLPDDKVIDEIDADIAKLEARKKGNDTKISAPLKWYADAVHETREKIKKGLPVAPESEQALWGQVSQGVGQAIGTLPTYAIPGLGPASTVGQLYQQGYEDAKEHGADEATAHDAGVKNVPAASLEYLSDKLIIGKVLKPLKGKLTVRQLLTSLAVSAASEGTTEAGQQAWQNYVASSLAGFDPDRKLDDGVINAAVVGATVGGLVGGGGPLLSEGARRIEERDTGMNKPERPEDLRAQQQQLVDGNRAAQMFPLGTEELPLPDGMQRVETPRGVFHFDPRRMTADEILSASKNGRENEVLGLGPFGKDEVMKRAAAGEPVAVVTERGPNGEELRGALAVPSTVEETKAYIEGVKSPDSTVQVEKLPDTLAKRDVAAEIERTLPDGESKDYVRGRTKQDLKRQADTEVNLPALWKTTVDAVLAAGVSPKEFSALDRNLELLSDKESRKEAGLKAKVTPERITAMLGNTVLDGALRGSDFTRLVNALAKSPDNIAALRAEFAAARETPSAPAAGSLSNPTEPSRPPVQGTISPELAKLLDEMERLKQPMKVFNERAMGARESRIRELRDQLDTDFPGWRPLAVKRATEAETNRARLREQIAADAELEKKNADEVARKKAAAEKALADAAAKRKAESERLAAIDRTGRDPESGLIADLRKVPTAELENFDWDKDRYMHGGDEVKPEDIEAVLMKRAQDEERAAANENRAGFTLLGLLKGKPADLAAAGRTTPLRLMSPKEARERGTLGGEHAALRERTGGFAYFSKDGLVEDGLEEALRELGFDVPDTAAAYALVERAMKGEEITPQRTSDEQVNFTRRPQFAKRAPADEVPMQRRAEQWFKNLQRIAPGLAKEAELRFGDSEQLVEQGLARRDELTGEEEAARVRDFRAKREIFYLFERALKKNTDDVTRLNLQHEMGHAFWDTLDRTTQRQLQELFAREVETKTGPLFDTDGELRENVALGATEDVQEWFAERLAHANDRWAQRRIETSGRGDTVLATLAAAFRRLLLQMRELIEKHLGREGYNDGLLADFRQFLNQGTAWNRETVTAGEPAAAPAFARRAKDDAEFNEALKNFDRLERESDRQLEKYGKTDRELLGQLSDARMILENSWPGWREDLKERRAEEEANATVPPEPEPGVSADDDEGRQVKPEVTRAKISALMASHYRPPGRLQAWLEGLGRMFLNFRSSIPELPGGAKGREFIRFRQGHRMLQAATETVRRDAEDRVAHILQPIMAAEGDPVSPAEYRRLVNLQASIRDLDQSADTPAKALKVAPQIRKLSAELKVLEDKLETLPYHLFRKIVLMRDLWFRGKLLNLSGEPITLPFHLTREGVEVELRRLHDKLAKSPQRAAIEESLKRHYQLVKTTREDLLARGYVIPEELRNPLYFPHLVLDKFNGRLQSVKMDTAEQFRGYLQQLVGSAKDIETDYLTAMYYHLGQVMAHNARQDIVAEYWQPYDQKKKLEEEAAAISAERAEKGLGPIQWQQLVGKDQAIYTVDDRIPVRPEYVINRQVLADRLGVELGEGDLQAQLRELGLNVTITAEDVRQAMAAGEKQVWVLPRPVAAALEGIVERETKSNDQMRRVLALPQTAWKWWKLFAPTSVIRYTYGNVVADMEKLFSVDPRVFTYLLPAYREVKAFNRGGTPSEDLREAFRRGVLQTPTEGEAGDIVKADRFEAFLSSREKLLGNIMRGVQWGAHVNGLREGAFRYAKFKADMDRLRRGERPVYAGAYHRDVDAITDSKPGANDANFAKAAEIARKTFVDYEAISVSGDHLRRYWVPFYSWAEGNFRYHANLFRNLGDMSAGAATALLARGSLAAASKAVVPRSVTGVLIRLALPYVAVGLWNSSGDRGEIEKDLSEEDRRRFHVILGRDENGKAIVVYAPTALSDVMEWFGGNEFARLAMEYHTGRITFPHLVHEWVANVPKQTANKALQGINPFFKTAVEVLSRKGYFPDFTDARTIPDYDMKWHVLGNMTDQFTADAIQRVADENHYSPRTWGEQLQQIVLQARRRDPEQWGYYATLDRVDAWKVAHGGGYEPGADNREEAQLLRSFRRAIRSADVPAAVEFYHRLLKAGYTAERFAASVRASDPLQTLKREERRAFYDSLSPAEQHDVENAYRYAQRMEAFKNKERRLFPSQKASAAYKERFADNPRDDLFAGIMLEAAGRSDDAEEMRAEKLLQRALRPR
jgi:hypothetical protein